MARVEMIEQSLIGCILLEPKKVMPIAAEYLQAEDFLDPVCSTIFEACNSLFMAGKPVDVVTVLSAVGDEYREYLIATAKTVPSTSNYMAYIKLTLENSRRAHALEKCIALHQSLSGDTPLDECQTQAADIAQGISINKGSATTAAEGFDLVVSSFGTPREFIQTGFSRLDNHLHFNLGDYMVIGGRPSAGKTALTLQMALKMAERHEVVYFSLETSARKVFERLITKFTATPLEEVQTGRVREPERIKAERENFSKLKLQVINAAGWTVQQIKAKSIQSRAEIVFIDYLGLIKGTGSSIYERVTNISSDLRTMAQQTGVAVVALSQLNRGGAGAPDMTALRESGQIEQDADAILLLSTPDLKNPTIERELIIGKNKTGKTGKMKFNFSGAYQTFWEVSDIDG